MRGDVNGGRTSASRASRDGGALGYGLWTESVCSLFQRAGEALPLDGELYYLSPAGALMAVPVNIAAEVFSHGAARELFRTRIAATEMADAVHPYDVSADGRFLMRVPGELAAEARRQ